MWRRVQIIVLMLAADLPASADQVTSARFQVQAMGVGAGTLQPIASVSAQGYSASTQFATTGAGRQVAKVKFTMKSSGRRFSVAMTYGPGTNGMMQARKMRLQTVYGPVVLTRH